ncbi:hypothetical protein [Streptomyces sp. AGS-58]|uniref:hypothetical protein n=1 Tax=unclassified Streptomyces TaxID=2593676 RepID=UPI0035A32712
MVLHDSALLGLGLTGHPDDFRAAGRECEHVMLEHTSATGRQSAHFQEILMSPDAGRKMLAFFPPG